MTRKQRVVIGLVFMLVAIVDAVLLRTGLIPAHAVWEGSHSLATMILMGVLIPLYSGLYLLISKPGKKTSTSERSPS